MRANSSSYVFMECRIKWLVLVFVVQMCLIPFASIRRNEMPQGTAHSDYCTCLNCAGESICCCEPDGAAQQQIACQMKCDKPLDVTSGSILPFSLQLPALSRVSLPDWQVVEYSSIEESASSNALNPAAPPPRCFL